MIYLHDARQPLGDRRAHRRAALALHLSDERRLPHRPSRRRRLQGLGLPDDARRASARARRAHRQACEWNVDDRRREARLLVDQRAAGHPQSPDRRRVRRLRQPAGHPASRSTPRPASRSGRSTARRRPARRGSISGGATGGQMWMTGTYDPELNLLYVGTGNPTPVLNGPARPGDNPWTCSIVALNPDTGKLAWGFQASPHDTHDWDAAEVPVLVDARFQRHAAQAAAAGVAQRLLLRARSHDRQEPADDAVRDGRTGRRASTRTAGRFPIPTRSRRATDGWSRPNEGRRHQLPIAELRSAPRACSIVSAHDAYGIYFFKPEHGAYGWAGADYTRAWSRGAARASTIRPARSAGATTSTAAPAPPAC